MQDLEQLEVIVGPHLLSEHLTGQNNTFDMCCAGAIADAIARATAEPQLVANQQTGLRLVCNMCKHGSLRSWLQSNSSAVLDRFGPCCTSTNKSVRLAFATLLLNLAVLSSNSKSSSNDVQAQVTLQLGHQLDNVCLDINVFTWSAD